MIGCVCKSGDTLSLAVLIDRGLDLTIKRITERARDANASATEGSTHSETIFIQFSGYQALKIVGVDGGEGTPVPIPNTAVKLTCADNTWLVAARNNHICPQGKCGTQQNPRPYWSGVCCVGVYLSSRAATSQVLSAQVSLTAVFGMGTGVPSPPSTPTIFRA